jgi:serine/threonine protein kinase/formylglycine-generating enzyme required for sulfatase activity
MSANTDPPSLEIGSMLGKFRLVKILGEGGMGKVFLAHDQTLDRQVALKVMQPEMAIRDEARQRFLREARLAASLEHDRIVRIYHVDEDRGIPFIAMELLKGETLQTFLEREGVPPVGVTIKVIAQILQGLAAAHEHGLIHRDIKPANIWMEPQPGKKFRIKILDFGLARSEQYEEFQTQARMVVGTLDYMSFEQLDGKPLDGRADLFSVGVVFYQMLTGRLPFPGKSIAEKAVQLKTTIPESPSLLNLKIPLALAEIAMRLLQRDRENRPTNATEVIRNLDSIVKQSTEIVKPPVEPARPAVKPPPPSSKSIPQIIFDEPEPEPPPPWAAKPKPQPPPVQPAVRSVTPPPIPRSSAEMYPLDTIEERRPQRRPPPPPHSQLDPIDEPQPGSILPWVLVGVAGTVLIAVVVVLLLPRGGSSSSTIVNNPPKKEPEPIKEKEPEPKKIIEPEPKKEPPIVKKEPETMPIPKKEPETMPIPKKEPPVPIAKSPPLLDCTPATGASETTVKNAQRDWADFLGVPVELSIDLGDNVKLEFVLIPPGRYWMGTSLKTTEQILNAFPSLKRELLDDEGPEHEVIISKAFYLAKTELTRAQFSAFVQAEAYITDAEQNEGSDGWDHVLKRFEGVARKYSWRSVGWPVEATHPVTALTQNDCKEFMAWIDRKRVQFPKGFTKTRLPTEAEWEYSCRAGSRTWYFNNSNDPEKLLQIANVGDASIRTLVKDWMTRTIDGNDTFAFTAPVGRFSPNAFGLFDMLGNVDERCEDGFDDKAYEKHGLNDPKIRSTGQKQVARGGSWRDSPTFTRCSFRVGVGETESRCDCGFRPVIFME